MRSSNDSMLFEKRDSAMASITTSYNNAATPAAKKAKTPLAMVMSAPLDEDVLDACEPEAVLLPLAKPV